MPGVRKIRLTFTEEGVSAIATLLDDKAPQTAQLIWDVLEEPLENKAIHAMFTGRELSYGIPESRIAESRGLSIPPENQTMFPLPGDLVWNAYLPYQWQGVPHPVYDFGIYYGRDCRILLPTGWRPSNRFGEITENLADFAAVCARLQSEGLKTIRLERA